MARTKRTSTVLETVRQRLAGLKSITPAPDFGTALSLTGYETDINALSNKLDSYNEELSRLDQLQNELDTVEAGVREKNVRILSAAEAHLVLTAASTSRLAERVAASANAPARKGRGHQNH